MIHDQTPTFLYVATGRHGTKVGITTNLEVRMAHIGCEPHKTYFLPEKSRRVELAAHRLMGCKPCFGREWFDVKPRVAVLAVENALEHVGISYELRSPPVLGKKNEIIGYARTGTYTPGLYAQFDRLRKVGVKEDFMYLDQGQIGPHFEMALKATRPRDYFVVDDMQVLGRNSLEQMERVAEIVKSKVKFMLA